jgi:hypothetical protein
VYYAITPYVLADAAKIIVVLIISSFFIFKFTKDVKSDQAPLYIFFAIMVSVLAFTALEVILHLTIQKHPISGAFIASLAVYLLTASILLAQLKLNSITCITYITFGAAIFFVSCLPIILWFGCATGPTCI